ncbi:MAG: VWA domain-containing protein [Planctomycetota bacterium]|nr:VWA domain-containing protein [Planctomycetota bacterium]
MSSAPDMVNQAGMSNVPVGEPRHKTWKTVLPSWLLSAVVHAAIAALMIWLMRPQTTGGIGDNESDFRNVGLFVVPAAPEAGSETESETQNETLEPVESQSLLIPSKLSQELPALSNTLPVELPELKKPSQVLGPGRVGDPLATSANDPDDLIRPNGRPNKAAGSSHHGESASVKFFDAEGNGSRFVFVIDSSSSMAEFNAMRMAKAQLMASLQQIQNDQEFQIIFYNTEYRSLTVRNDPPHMMPATSINRVLAGTFIDAVQPTGGTIHKPALELALSFKPDVIFLLTDAGQPVLGPKELQEIKNINRGKTKIHTIEFGERAQLRSNDPQADNFLIKLARQNGGTYVYRDVRDFQQR